MQSHEANTTWQLSVEKVTKKMSFVYVADKVTGGGVGDKVPRQRGPLEERTTSMVAGDGAGLFVDGYWEREEDEGS